MRRGFALLIALSLLACGRPAERAYYTLRYPAPAQQVATPHAKTIRVKPLTVRESYDRPELAIRRDLVELSYRRGRRWAERPHRMITSLLRDHVQRSGLAEHITEEIGQTPPDFTLTGEVHAIEQLVVGEESYSARLAMTLQLIDFQTDTVVWTYDFDERRPVGDGLPRTTVRTHREILAEQFDRAIQDLDRHLQGKPKPAPAVEAVTVQAGEGIIGPDERPENQLPQVANDATPIPVGRGAVFLPAFTNGTREPPVAVYRGKKRVAEGRMGQRIVLEPGEYEVWLGSGTGQEQLQIKVHIAEGKTTVLPRTLWSGLMVNVVDNQFVPFRGAYELIRMETREDYGLGFGADQLQGEQLRVWIVPAGLYKIIRSGGTYRDRTDFATVRLQPGELSRFSLVVDPDTGQFLGAGEDDPSLVGDEAKSDWTLRGVLGGSADFNRGNQVGQLEGWNLGLAVFFDATAAWRHEKHQWVTRLELQEEQSRAPGTDFSDGSAFINQADRLFLHTIYTYNLLQWFGPYARAGMTTSIFDRHQYFDGDRVVDRLDGDGNVEETLMVAGTDRVGVASAFAPTTLVQGAGGNFRILRRRNFELDFRVGLGGRQVIANGLYVFNDVDDPTQNDTLTPVDTTTLEGGEGTVIGLARLSRYLTIATEFEGFLPFSDGEEVFTWRNQVSLRLAQFASIVYRFNAFRDPNIDVEDRIRTDQTLQLRFSYTLF